MTFFPNDQTFVAFKLFGLTFDIRWYAVCIMLGAFLAYRNIKKEIINSRYISLDFFDTLFIYTLWVGILGARIWYCAFYNFSFYFSDPSVSGMADWRYRAALSSVLSLRTGIPAKTVILS